MRNPEASETETAGAHALQKPVVLVSSNEKDVPFDVQHIRVIYYNVLNPFWGEKLIAKVAENLLSAIQNPEAVEQRFVAAGRLRHPPLNATFARPRPSQSENMIGTDRGASFDCNEPAHVYVERESSTCKFWLEPIELARSHGFQRPRTERGSPNHQSGTWQDSGGMA